MKRLITLIVSAVVLAAAAAGCGTAGQMASMGLPADYAKSPLLDTRDYWRTAVLPMASPVPVSGIDLGMLSDYAGMALLRTGKFTVVDRSALDEILEEQELSYSGIVDQSTAVELGRIMGAEAVMTVRVGSISHDAFWSDEPDQRDADIHVRIISVETSEVLYTATGQGNSFEGAEDALKMAVEVALIGLFR